MPARGEVFPIVKVLLLSDLHLEFEEFSLGRAGADVVVLAGDIHAGKKALAWIRSNFPDTPVVYVLGNHEYYGKAHPKLARELVAATAGSHIHVLENRAVTLEGVTFHGATLWTDFQLFGDPRMAGFECQQVMTDFKKIRREPRYARLRSLDVALIHQQSVAWLRESFSGSSRPNVVVSHHAPSLRSVPAQLHHEIATAAYASHLDGLIAELAPEAWLHGHLHASSDYRIGGCRVVCNPRGYPGELNPGFDPALLIEVGRHAEGT